MTDEPSSAQSDGRLELARRIAAEWARGRLNAEQILPALVAVLGQPSTTGATRHGLLLAIEREGIEGLAPLRHWLRSTRAADARAAHEHRRRREPVPFDLAAELADLPADVPVGWARTPPEDHRLATAVSHQRDRLFVDSRRHDAPKVAAAVDRAAAEAARDVGELPSCWAILAPGGLLRELRAAAAGDDAAESTLRPALDALSTLVEAEAERARAAVAAMLGPSPTPFPPDLDEGAALQAIATRYADETDRTERGRLLDWVLAWSSDRAAPFIEAMCDEPWAQDRAALVLTLRFGQAFGLDWEAWRAWLRGLTPDAPGARPPRASAEELLLVWCAARPEERSHAEAALLHLRHRMAEPVSAEGFVRRWERVLPAAERTALLGLPPAPPPPPPEEVPPSFWREHVQGFLAENWYLAAGVVMVVVGASLLAYFTWDRHWLLRYTIMPGLLALFTFALAGTACWLEVRDDSLRGTGATLRGAAIGLLPVNFMAVALLADDPSVSRKLLAVPLMAATYVAVFGWGLVRWCREVSPRLRPVAASLLVIDGLVLLPSLSRAVAGPRLAMPVLIAGFYFGFFVMAAAVVRFARDGLDEAAVGDRRVPWFVGGTLVLTYLEVFAWVHGGLRWVPPAHLYAPLVVLSGGLVLYAERRFLELSPEPGRHRVESFLGFAVLLLGVLMGASDPSVRIATLALAGGIWLYQAAYRAEALHYWIGLVLLVLAGAAVGLLPAFPGPWLPVLGIALAVGVGVLGSLAPRVGEGLLRATCRELQAAVLMMTAAVAVLAQWHFRSWPPGTAITLGLVVLLFAWRAHRDEGRSTVHTAAVVASMALPYLGFVDLEGRTLRGNTMVFGLGLLAWAWIALVHLARRPLLLGARSTVLWMYGAFALGAMVLRVLFERGRAVDPLWYRSYPEYVGPFLIAAALLVATYTSRSLVPAAMASAIAVILFPELKANFQATFPRLGWGTGYGSAWTALLLVLASFRLRSWPRLSDLGEGDPFLGREPFPFRRFDHTLFTAPFLATAVFLVLKVDFWTFPRHLDDPVAPVRTGMALCITGAAWTLLAVYLRHWRWAKAGVHLGWVAVFVGVPIVWDGLVEKAEWQHVLMALLLVLQGLETVYRRLVPRHPWIRDLLAHPTRSVLRFWSLAFALLVGALVVTGMPLSVASLLLGLLAAELAKEAVGRRKLLDGWVLCGLGYVVLLAASAPGTGPLSVRLSVENGLWPTLSAIVAVQVIHVALEGALSTYLRLRPILFPAQALATLLAASLGALGLGLAVLDPTLSTPQHALLAVAVLLTARAHASGPGALLGLLLGYELAHFEALGRLPDLATRLEWLTVPSRFALLALVMALLGEAGRRLSVGAPRALAGAFPFPRVGGPALPWIHAPAVVAALIATAHHALRADLRADAAELAAPHLATLTAVLVGWSASWPVLFPLGSILLSVGNVHLVRLFFGERLRAGGLSEVHLVTLALGLTLAQGSLVRLLARRDAVTAFVNRASLVLGALVLSLLSATYAAHPSLEAMTPLRFATSGLMALAAGWYFRKAARRPARGEESYAGLCEGLYHFGLAVAVWCAALLVPWFRRPATALLALGLPAFYFYLRAELGRRSLPDLSRRYRHSAALLSLVLLGLYAFRPFFQMTLFPNTTVWTDHYHYYAAFAMGLGLLMMRVTGLGGTDWLALYGGLSLMAGSYFGTTAWPGLSPFVESMPAAWCAVGLAHFWTVASSERSPLRSFLQELSGLSDDGWIRLRKAWGRAVLVASEAAVFLGILDPATDSYMVAPLLLGAATIVAHHAVLYESPWRFVAAGIMVTLGVHADFVVPSTLPRDLVVWVVLLAWAAILLVARRLALPPRRLAPAAAVLAAMAFGHVLYHHPSSDTGLWALAAIAFLAALTPVEAEEPRAPEEHLAAWLLLLAPSWLVFFSQAPLLREGPAGALHTWPLLTTATSVFVTGLLAVVHRRRPPQGPPPPHVPRLWHHLLASLVRSGATIHALALGASFVAAVLLQVAHHGRPYATRDLVLFCLLYASLAVAWYHEGGRRRQSLPYLLAELSVLGGFALVRSQLLLTTPHWRYEYDVWTSLAVSFLLVGAKESFDRRPPELRRPYVASILALPAIAVSWTLVHHLGTDVALIVVGLHSLLFASLGRDRRDSPYNFVATAGFVTFVLMVFWTKLELRVLSAYVLPVGLGVLALLQMFGQKLPAETRNRVRLVTLLSMLASASYYALVDDRYPLAFNLTLLVLCLAAMALGSLLRIRLYLVLGFAGLLLDVGSILVKALVHMERGERMTSVGLLVLLLGAGLVGGAAYYKTHRAELDARLQAWRGRLRGWE